MSGFTETQVADRLAIQDLVGHALAPQPRDLLLVEADELGIAHRQRLPFVDADDVAPALLATVELIERDEGGAMPGHEVEAAFVERDRVRLIAEARIDFSTFNGPVGDLAEIKRFLANSLPFFTRTQHMMGLPHIEIDGDTAHARTSCTNPMVSTKPDGTTSVWLIGLWYDDDLVRTPDGWRFIARNQIRSYTLTGLTDTPLGA